MSHTHWDREWYLTYHRFRVDLIRVVKRVLERLEADEDFRHFLLDGQAVILEDYLAIHPEDEDRIRKLVDAGKLSVGPWYILPDEFLVSGEATVRNLIVGHQVVSRFGRAQKVGYLPDSFGHIAQMPQILQQAGIDSFIYTRGNGDEIDDLGCEYRWIAPDGSEVLAVHQCGGYCNAGGLGYQAGWHAHTEREVDLKLAVRQVWELFEKMRPLSGGDIYLLNNGCDHYPPQQEFGPILDALRDAFPETEFRHASLVKYVNAVRSAAFARKRFAGELACGKLHLILSGVWSSRMYLKQRNDTAQTILSGYLEPVSAYTHFWLGRPYPQGLIDYAWTLLLKNHPHDSICGCSTDEVHQEMGPRFAGVSETAERALLHQLEMLAPTWARREQDDHATVICVMNALPEARTEIVQRLVVLEPGGIDVTRLELVDDQDAPVPLTVLRTDYVERFWGIDYRTSLFADQQRELFQLYRDQLGDRILRSTADPETTDCFLTIQFVAQLPAVGHAIFRLRERAETDGPPDEPVPMAIDGATLENEHVRVHLMPNGVFDLIDRTTDRTYPGLNRLEDTEDVGDEYDYSPSAESRTITSDSVEGRVRVLEDSGLRARLEAEFSLQLPAAIERDRKHRNGRLVDCAVRVRVGLARNSPLVDVELVFDNRAEDHRLRVQFPTSIQTDAIVSDGQFYLNQRPVEFPKGSDWKQPPAGTYPQQEFSLVQDGERGLAVLNRGLPEIAPFRRSGGGVGLALTLLRAVGWLSRDDFPARRYTNAGPILPTPAAQCLGEHRFRYAVVPFAGDHLAANIKGLSAHYRTPVLAVQGVEDQHIRGGASLVRKESRATAITALKKHETRDTLIVRLYNITAGSVEETLTFGLPIRAAWRTNLLEQRTGTLDPAGTALLVAVQPHEIVTIEVQFA